MEEVAYICVSVLGILANIVLLTILFRHEKGWSLGRTVLVFLHVTELILLFVQLPPYIAVIATAPTVPGSSPVIYLPGYTTECAIPAIASSSALTLEPYILALLAHVRWSVVKSSTNLHQKGKQPNVRMMIAALLVFVAASTTFANLTDSNRPVYFWSPLNVCFGGNETYLTIVLVSSFCICALYIGYCYFNVIRVLRDRRGAGANPRQMKKRSEAIRLLLVLTGYYYLSHALFFAELIKSQTGTSPNGLLGIRAYIIVYNTFATMSPILSILLTERYRIIAMRMFGLLPSGTTLSGSGNNTATSSQSHSHTNTATTTVSVQRAHGNGHAKKYSVSSPPLSVHRGSVASSTTAESAYPHKGAFGNIPGGAGFVQPVRTTPFSGSDGHTTDSGSGSGYTPHGSNYSSPRSSISAPPPRRSSQSRSAGPPPRSSLPSLPPHRPSLLSLPPPRRPSMPPPAGADGNSHSGRNTPSSQMAAVGPPRRPSLPGALRDSAPTRGSIPVEGRRGPIRPSYSLRV